MCNAYVISLSLYVYIYIHIYLFIYLYVCIYIYIYVYSSDLKHVLPGCEDLGLVIPKREFSHERKAHFHNSTKNPVCKTLVKGIPGGLHRRRRRWRAQLVREARAASRGVHSAGGSYAVRMYARQLLSFSLSLSLSIYIYI